MVRRIKNTDWHDPLHMQFDSETMPTWFGMPKDEDLPSTYSIKYLRAWQQGSRHVTEWNRSTESCTAQLQRTIVTLRRNATELPAEGRAAFRFFDARQGG